MQGIRRTRYLPEGELRLSAENRAAMRSRESIEEAARRGTILESACLLCDCASMQLTVEMPDGMRGIIPRAEVGFLSIAQTISLGVFLFGCAILAFSLYKGRATR